jgi:elongation factor P hydroxylase
LNSHASQTLEELFQQCFYDTYATRLRGGVAEPLYQPASTSDGCAVIYYREDYFASALHEVAHWCIAGVRRRRVPDYGYWYHPDGRSPEQQRAFERAEQLPQALEWHFALACDWPFRISNDNLAEDPLPGQAFAAAVSVQARRYCESGLPARAEQFRAALARHFGGSRAPSADSFGIAGL